MTIDSNEEKNVKEAQEREGKSPENTVKDGVIGNMPQQNDFTAAKAKITNASDGSLGKLAGSKNYDQFKSIELFDGDVTVSRTKPGSESSLIAGREAPPKIAYDLKDLVKDFQKGIKQAESLNPERLGWVHRGQEDNQVDYISALEGFHAARLDQYPLVSKGLVAAAIRNEQHFYKATDADQDKQVREAGTVTKEDGSENWSASIGPAQMQIRKIRELVNAVDIHTNKPKYPFLSHMKADPIRVAEDPRNAALLVSAYFADSAEKLKSMRIEVNDQTLSYTYNPDVFRTNGSLECPSTVQLKAERQLPQQLRPQREPVWNPSDPAVLSASTHVRNVDKQLKIVARRYEN